MGLEKGFDLPLHPDGLFGVGGTDNDEKIRIFQGMGDIVGEIAGDGQLVFIPEQTHFSGRSLLQHLWDPVMLQPSVDLLRNLDI